MTAKKKTSTKPENAVIAYKGFDTNLVCDPTGSNPFQYEIGKTYKHKGDVVRCKAGGFHACESPLDVVGYYSPATSRYAEVTMSGQIDRDGEDTKIAAAQITINLELKIPDLVKRAVDWVMAKIDTKIEQVITNNAATNTGNWSAATNTGKWSAATNTGKWSAATNTGDQSAATNTGDRSAATNTGNWSAATNTGNLSAATNTGNWSAATNTGNWSAATNTGDQSAATNTGDRSAATNTGNQSAATNTGNWSAATNTGNWSAATNTGDWSAATNTGKWSAATNTGDRSAATNTGNWSAATNTGNRSAATVEGKDSVAIATGYQSKAKASEGSAIVLVYRDQDMRLIHIRAGIAGRDVKPDVFYTLDANGEFKEAA
jgi:hypothetical protein